MRFLLALAAALALGSIDLLGAQTYDLVLRGGRLIDGTGNPAVFADLAIKDGRIAATGVIPPGSGRELDVRGLVVTPGFIDVHTHAEDIEELPQGANFARMGVTTVVMGNCGSSVLNVGEFFTRLESTGLAINVATLIGHGTVRSKAMGGSFDRPPTAVELEQMRSMVGQAMKDGAVGISTGLIYLPGTFARTEELIEVAKVASAYDGIYASHMRSESDRILDSLAEVFRIAREAKMRAEVSHIKLAGKANWGRTEQVLAAIEAARASGLDITQDQYVYTASSTSIGTLIPDAAREGGRQKFIERIGRPAEKASIAAEMKQSLARRGVDSFAYAVIASYRHDPSCNGLNIVEAARKQLGGDSLDQQVEMILEIERNGGAQGVFHGMSESDLQNFSRHPNTMFASDSGVRKFKEGVPHPRGYGNNARVLSRYVRELKVLRLEEAVRRMTSLPAATFHLQNRGEIRTGNWADVVVFDPEKVRDNATFSDPHHYATGFRYVLVNGAVVVEDDHQSEARPGRPLRNVAVRKSP